MDAYHKELNGKQAAWASQKYCAHHMLPDLDKLLKELNENKVA
jgi:hypothetical protein